MLTFKSDIKVCGEKVSECMSSSFEVADYESNPPLLVTGCCQLPSDENEYATNLEESDCRRLFGESFCSLVWLATLLLWVVLVFVGCFCFFGRVSVPVPLLLARLFDMWFGGLVTTLFVHAMANITFFSHVGRFHHPGICQIFSVGPSTKLGNIHLFSCIQVEFENLGGVVLPTLCARKTVHSNITLLNFY